MHGSDLHDVGRKANAVSRLAGLLFGIARDERRPRRRHWLDRAQRAGEIACGLLVTILFTGTFAIAGGQASTTAKGALAAALAWSGVCAVVFLRRNLAAREARQRLRQQLLGATSPDAFVDELRHELPPSLVEQVSPHDLHRMRARVRDTEQEELGLAGELQAAGAVLLIVLAGLLPAVLPLWWAADGLHLAYGIAIAELFVLGGFLGHHAGLRPVLLGLCLAAAGALLAGIGWLLQP